VQENVTGAMIAARRSTMLVLVLSCLAFGSTMCNIAATAEEQQIDSIVDQNVTAGATDVDSAKLDALTKQILLRELELERLSTRFQIETTLTKPWRQRRVFAYGEANAGLTLAGLLCALPVRYQLAREVLPPGFKGTIDTDEELPEVPPNTPANSPLRNRGGINTRARLEDAGRLQVVGSAIGAGGDIIELGLNFEHYLWLKRNGFSPATYRHQVQLIHSQLDDLIRERHSVLAASNLSTSDRQAAESEEQLLGDLRGLALVHYSDFHSATRRFWAFQNTAFLVDLSKNLTSMSGNVIGLVGTQSRRNRMAGGAGLFGVIAGGIVLLTPIFGRVTGNVSGLAAKRSVSKELTDVQSATAAIYAAHKQNFAAVTNEATDNTPYLIGARRRQAFYDEHEKLLVELEQFFKRQRKSGRDTTRENIAFAAAVGPPRIANGVTGILGGWDYYGKPPTANKVYAAGLTTYTAGTGINILETARVFVSSEVTRRTLAKRNQLPRQRLNARIRVLDDMSQILKK
jgi:hypothetical protein